MLTIGSLFSGIGGLELGLEWAGLGPVLWQVERDEFRRSVLAKHWPDVPRWSDVETVRAAQLHDVDLICGGFPCQDVSAAGKNVGIVRGERSGLWRYFARLVEQKRPPWVVIENVAVGRNRWLCAVRTHLHQLGYRTRAMGIAARDVGAAHLRNRVFVVAHAHQKRCNARLLQPSGGTTPDPRSRSSAVGAFSWGIEPDLVRAVHGIPHRVDRVASLGDAVVPQAAQVVGEVIRQILEAAA
jgi:DNA (cytosine-5)-methyltransferase 1